MPGIASDSCTSTPRALPDLDVAQVDHVWRTLDAAAARWRVLDLGRRVERLAEIAAQLCNRGPGPWREPLVASTGLSSPGLDAAWKATFAPCDAAALARALRAEGIDAATLSRLEAEGKLPRRLLHVVPGNVLPATFGVLVRGWLLGAAQWLRPSVREPLFALCLAEALGELAADLAAAVAVLWWPHEGWEAEAAVLAGAQFVTAQGDDESVRAVSRKVARLAPAARFTGFGARWSAALVSRAGQTPAAARALAWDVALFDQQGCLSPILVLAEGGPDLEAWCGTLAEALQELETSMPRGPLPAPDRAALRQWRESLRLGSALGEVAGLWESRAATAWGVALLERCRYEESPRGRHVIVVPFSNLDEIRAALGAQRERLQGLAVALAGWDEGRRREALEMLHPTRVAPLGSLQLAPPVWEQDHVPPLGGLLL